MRYPRKQSKETHAQHHARIVKWYGWRARRDMRAARAVGNEKECWHVIDAYRASAGPDADPTVVARLTALARTCPVEVCVSQTGQIVESWACKWVALDAVWKVFRIARKGIVIDDHGKAYMDGQGELMWSNVRAGSVSLAKDAGRIVAARSNRIIKATEVLR